MKTTPIIQITLNRVLIQSTGTANFGLRHFLQSSHYPRRIRRYCASFLTPFIIRVKLFLSHYGCQHGNTTNGQEYFGIDSSQANIIFQNRTAYEEYAKVDVVKANTLKMLNTVFRKNKSSISNYSMTPKK